jgi:uncharacterized protein (TIGR03663 family)
MTKKVFGVLFLLAVLGALAFRLPRLGLRPMHADEANQAVKFGDLLEHGEYRFDPHDHHGPTLYYLTLPAAWAAGDKTLADLDERVLRLVPAVFGAGLLLLLLLLAGGLPREAILAAAGLAAVSPALTYYSRFYIQETLLVFFLAALIGAGWRYAHERSILWALAAGISAGLMLATKETSLILIGALAAAFAVLSLLEGVRTRSRGVITRGEAWVWRDTRTKLPGGFHAVVFLAAALAVTAAFYTSFFRNPAGLADLVRAVGAWVGRAGHPGVHAHPWSFYFQILAYARMGNGPVWSEAFVLVLAVIGGLAALGRDAGRNASPRFLRFILFFTVITAAVYSAIPYKTPWNVLPFYLGLVILAGHGAAWLLRVARPKPAKAVILVFLILGAADLARQDYRANFVRPADPSNPYVYAQTSPDLLKLVAAVNKAAAVSPEKRDILVEVISPADETWPLPWYFRMFGRVGYWISPETAAQALPYGKAEVVITSSAFADEVGAGLGEGYEQTFYGLRPEVVLSLFVRRSPQGRT